MKVTLTASTAEQILVWREGALFHAERAESAAGAQVCLAVDLFEVIAELAGLDLEQGDQAAEALSLADAARAGLEQPAVPSDDHDGNDQRMQTDGVS